MISKKDIQALIDTMRAALVALEPDATNVQKLTAQTALLTNSRSLTCELDEQSPGRSEALAVIFRATQVA